MMSASSSGTWQYLPALSELLLDAYSRIQIYAPAIEDKHIIEARRSMNLLLLDWGNRGINLFEVDQITIPMVPGVSVYTLPGNTLNVLDSYLRQYSSGPPAVLGNALTVMTTALGDPMLTALGEPMTIAPSSGVFSTVAGSQIVTMLWPNHGLRPGEPIFLGLPTTIGSVTFSGNLAVSTVVDHDTIQFIAPVPSLETLNGVGGTPLFVTKAGSSSVTVISAGHGVSVGQSYPVPVATAVGGITLAGSYAVTGVLNSYSFTIAAGAAAAGNAVGFENNGEILVSTQSPNAQSVDILMWPISRNDYAALPTKNSPGRPSIFWFDRILPPTVTVWPVPPVGSNYGFVAYRTRDVMDANPQRGQALDTPRRFYAAFVAELTAYLAEKFRPEQYAAKVQTALLLWERASMEDREKVSSYIVPNLTSYYR